MKRIPIACLVLSTLAAGALAQDGEDERIARVLEKEVSLEFLETPLARALESIQETHGLTIVLDPTISPQNVTLRVQGVALGETLRRLLSEGELAHVVEDGVVLVTERSTLERRRVEVRSYGVRDLVEPTRDYPGRRIGPDEGGGGSGAGGAVFAEPEGAEAFTIEELEEYIRSTVRYETWDSGWASIQVAGASHLVISQTPEVHAEIDALLEGLRQVRERQIAVEGRYYAVPLADVEAVLGPEGGRTVFLDAAGRGSLAHGGRLLDQLTVAGANTQRVNVRSTRGLGYVKDYDITVAQEAIAFDPIVDIVFEGMTLDVRPVLSPAGSGITIAVKSELVRFAAAPREVGATAGRAMGAEVGRGGRLQAIDSHAYDVDTLVRIPPGKGAVFVVASPLVAEGEVLVFLLTARAME